MMSRTTIARLLVVLYPSAWRREYGPELIDILTSRAIRPRVIVDVVWSGLWQRARFTKPSTVLGLVSLTLIFADLVVTPANDGRQWTALLQPAATRFAPMTLTFLTAQVYVLCMVACGCWTYLRDVCSPSRSGIAAMRMSLIAGLPIMIFALSILLGFIDLTSLAPQRVRPLPWVMLLSPILRLPEAWVWGVVGGMLGRRLSRGSRPIAALGD